MAAWKVVGNWLENFGWVEALIQGNVFSAGVADSLIKVSHVARTKQAHQITASTLALLLDEAYEIYRRKNSKVCASKETWTNRRKREIPQFQYWLVAFHLEVLVLSFVRSLRSANFQLYLECITKLTPWFFSLDHPNYARWMSVHARDMAALKMAHPQVAAAFEDGHFTVQKSKHAFSAVAIDQAHEQNNEIVKGDGGAVGLFQNEDSLTKWMVSGPEIARILAEFDAASCTVNRQEDMRHHDQSKGIQKDFVEKVESLTATITDMGNPFLEDSNDLLRLDNRDILGEDAVTSVRKAGELGQSQYDDFVAERLEEQRKPLLSPVTTNKLQLFRLTSSRGRSNARLKVASLQSDCSLFSRLFIACQTRDGNLDTFFQSCPPSLYQHGKLRSIKKADLLECLDKCGESRVDAPPTDVVILDGAVIVNMIRPANAQTFGEYALNAFLPYIKRQLESASRVDLVWDDYRKESLKGHTREKRGKGSRRRVGSNVALPGNWQQFLRNDENKGKLLGFLAKHATQIETTKHVITTYGQDVISVLPRDSSFLAPCNHEEADSRMILHAGDAAKCGFQRVTIRTVDTDVVVLAVSCVRLFSIAELWLAFGTGKHFRFIPAHEIAHSLGPQRSQALSMFHSFTGCDTVSGFATAGKKKAWETWKAFDDVTQALIALSESPAEIPDGVMTTLERFTILLYDRTSQLQSLNEARKHLFTTKSRTMESIPPTKAALIEHSKRAVLQGGHCWGQLQTAVQNLPCPTNWGWNRADDLFIPFWTRLPEASESCRELLRCGCKKGYRGHCKCAKAALKCTALCQCGGDCDSQVRISRA